jgi:hypothetical protein
MALVRKFPCPSDRPLTLMVELASDEASALADDRRSRRRRSLVSLILDDTRGSHELRKDRLEFLLHHLGYMVDRTRGNLFKAHGR